MLEHWYSSQTSWVGSKPVDVFLLLLQVSPLLFYMSYSMLLCRFVLFVFLVFLSICKLLKRHFLQSILINLLKITLAIAKLNHNCNFTPNNCTHKSVSLAVQTDRFLFEGLDSSRLTVALLTPVISAVLLLRPSIDFLSQTCRSFSFYLLEGSFYVSRAFVCPKAEPCARFSITTVWIMMKLYKMVGHNMQRCIKGEYPGRHFKYQIR